MDTGTAMPPPLPAESPAKQRLAQADNYIQQQIGRTRRQVKWVDIAAGVLWLAIGILSYLLVAALLDQWIVTGGLGFWGRLLLLAVLLGTGGWWFAVRLLPLLIYRINPLFAARTIEESQPTLKNSLINFLLLRGQRSGTPEVVYRAMQQRAATDLGSVPVELVVDRTQVVRLGYVLAGVLAVACLYLVVSPKNPLVSFGRVIFPWANISAPTRVTIDHVEPGDALISRGEPIPVSAVVRGLGAGESATFYYTTADGQSVDEAIPMAPVGEDSDRYEVPQDSFVAQQDAEYYLVAGDCTTRTFAIEVQVAPAIAVDRVTYDYPDYTKIPDATIENQGDIRAVEGTRVTIHATANLDIERAEIDLDCDGRGGLAMKIDGRKATGRFTVRMDADDPSTAEHESYRLQFTDTAGRRNRRPVRYQIEVIPDLAPRVSLASPGHDPLPEEIQLPVGSTLEFQVRAEDPDFGLRRVALRAQRQGRGLMIDPLLSPASSGAAARSEGPFEARYTFDPKRWELKPGDVVTYWAEAEDNRRPVANRSETERRRILIAAADPRGQAQNQPRGGEGGPPPEGQPQQPEEGDQPPQQQPGAEQPPEEGDQPPEENPEQKPPAEGQQPDNAQPKENEAAGPDEKQQPPEDQQTGAEQQQGNQAQQQEGAGQGEQDQPAEEESRTDPQSNPAEAFEKILEHQKEEEKEKQEQEKKQDGDPPEGQPDEPQQKPDEEPKENQDGQGESQPQEGGQGEPKPKPSDGQGEPQADQKPEEGPGGAGGQPQPAEQQPGGQPKPGMQQQPGEQPQPEDATGTGKPAPGEPKPDGQSKPAGQPGQENQPNEGQPGPGDPKQQADNPEQKPGEAAERGSQPGEKDPQRIPDNQPSGENADDAQPKPNPGDGAQSKGLTKPEKPEQQGEKPKGDPEGEHKGGDSEQGKGDAGAGKPSEQSTGSPSPQHNNRARDKEPGPPEQGDNKPQEEGKSPSISPKESDSKGDTSGTHSGGGQEGGGQRANQQGTGTAGTHSESDQGANAGKQKGQGETGTEGGDQVEADRQTGSSGDKPEGSGGEGRQKPGGGEGEKPSASQQTDPTGAKKTPSDQPGGQPQGESKESPNAHGAGNPTAGGKPGQQPDAAAPPPAEPLTGGDDPNLEYARKATGMALEHLRDQMTQEESELLDRLKWTRQDAEEFLRRWEQLRREGGEPGARADAGRKELDQALRNLGLRPRGTGIEGGQVKADQLQRLREARDFRPPPEWAEQFRAFKMGVSGQRDR